MNSDLQYIGERIRAERKAQNMSQECLAEDGVPDFTFAGEMTDEYKAIYETPKYGGIAVQKVDPETREAAGYSYPQTEVPRKTIPNDPETPKDPNAPSGSLLDLLAARADYFSEDAMEFILYAIDSGVDERAVRRMIAMDEGELLRICGEVG